MTQSGKTTEPAIKTQRAQRRITKDPSVKIIELVVAIVGLVVAMIGVVAAIIGVVGAFIQTCLPLAEKSCFPVLSPTPACIHQADVLVKFKILDKNNQPVATLAKNETILLEPSALVYFQPELTSTSGKPLPELECKWTNTGMATDGRLDGNTGCKVVSYQAGNTYIKDAISMELSQPGQPSCQTLGPYPFFIMPKP